MSHELDDNIERREHILAKIRQYPQGVSVDQLTKIIMEIGYNLRGAKEKIRELKFMGYIKPHGPTRLIAKSLDAEGSVTHTRTREKKGKVEKDVG